MNYWKEFNKHHGNNQPGCPIVKVTKNAVDVKPTISTLVDAKQDRVHKEKRKVRPVKVKRLRGKR